jgi:hypothetical protein
MNACMNKLINIHNNMYIYLYATYLTAILQYPKIKQMLAAFVTKEWLAGAQLLVIIDDMHTSQDSQRLRD